MKSFFFVAALLVTMSASAQMINTTQPYSGTTSNPCNGEPVSFSGSIHFVEKTQIASDGRIHYVANNNFSATGRGGYTGASYNIGGNMQTNSKFPTYPITFRQRSRFVSNSSAAPSFHATFAFRVNGNGVQTTVSTTSDCQG
jgi:opacity protein-like surface antigen